MSSNEWHLDRLWRSATTPVMGTCRQLFEVVRRLRHRDYEAGAQTLYFQGVLPPADSTYRSWLPGVRHGRADLDDLLAASLAALRNELAHAEAGRALPAAHRALSRLVAGLASLSQPRRTPEQTRVHAVVVELQSLSFEALPDGTLCERGTEVRIVYRSWNADTLPAGIDSQPAFWTDQWAVPPGVYA